MDFFKIIAVHCLCILVAAEPQSNRAVYCVLSETSSECVASSNSISSLSSLANITEERVRIYLSAGTHVLADNFNFSSTIKAIEIQGTITENGDASNILCQNASGFFFSENFETVVLANFKLEECSGKYYHNTEVPAGIFFDSVESVQLLGLSVHGCMGFGIHAHNCRRLIISDCEFSNNVAGHGNITFTLYQSKANVSVDIMNSSFCNGSSNEYRSGLGIYFGTKDAVITIEVYNTKFARNKGTKGSHMEIIGSGNTATTRVSVSNCVFTEGDGPTAMDTYGAIIESKDYINEIKVFIQNTNFTNSRKGGLKIVFVNRVFINDCFISNNTETGIFISQYLTSISEYDNSSSLSKVIHIASSTFTRNSRAIYLWLTVEENSPYLETKIVNCKFAYHSLLETSAAGGIVRIDSYTDYKYYDEGYTNNSVRIEEAVFERNSGKNGDCSSLQVTNMNKFIIKDSIFRNNNCTGISLVATTMTIENRLSMISNYGLHGGAILLESKVILWTESDRSRYNKFSSILLMPDSQLFMQENNAVLNGGGIHTDETCNYRNKDLLCFFQFEGLPRSNSLIFSGNTANMGGDSILGGCLTDCWLKNFQNKINVNVSDPKNVFWSIVMSSEFTSQSEIADYPQKVVFCNTLDQFSNKEQCRDTHAVTVYRGQVFELMLMVVDDSCIPTSSYIQASVQDSYQSSLKLLRGRNYRSTKNCTGYSYTLSGDPSLESAVMELSLQSLLTEVPPSILTIHFTDCPTGFMLDNASCVCLEVLHNYEITCVPNNASLIVPAFTWIGKINSLTAVSKFCQLCHIEIIRYKDSDDLCTDQRTGILCGSCSQGQSLLLGSYRCGKCDSVGHGVGLVLAFVFLGIALILLLFFLNITVSSGVLNALIFYYNIVYSNTDIFLPIEIGSTNRTSLQITVRYISTFLAWMNLDFGIATCFFNGYNTYISAWMQFIFPLYIWSLVLLIIIASRYSITVSRLTRSNTVSVLATLLLLSYAKLVTTCIRVVTFTNLEILGNIPQKKIVWFLDGNIPYLGKAHIPLFLMGIIFILLYILPFSFLVLLGPLLQAKSDNKFLHWINKLKPFLDSFYGPYTSGYRYWPGILLIARAALFICTIYSLGHSVFKLLSVVAVTTLLISIWFFISQKDGSKTYISRSKTYLELCIFVNLAWFSIYEAYLWSTSATLRNKQICAVIMILILACCVLLHCVNIKSRALWKVIGSISLRFRRGEAELSQSMNSPIASETINLPSHSTLRMSERNTFELREPLLESTN